MGYPHKEKKCGACQIVKPVEEFSPARKGAKGRDGYCKACRRVRDRQRLDQRNRTVLANKAKDPFFYRRKKLVKMYGITHEQYMEMQAEQDGLCAICRKPEKRILYGEVAHLAVDHDHATGKVRSLLCHRCNVGLGRVEDREFLAKALAYLRYHEALQEWLKECEQ